MLPFAENCPMNRKAVKALPDKRLCLTVTDFSLFRYFSLNYFKYWDRVGQKQIALAANVMFLLGQSGTMKITNIFHSNDFQSQVKLGGKEEDCFHSPYSPQGAGNTPVL
jgi:hypothetical protein